MLTLILAAINSPLAVLGTFFDLRDLSTYFILISWFLLDFFFIASYSKLLKPNKYELILFFLVFCSVFIGFINSNELSRNFITDFTNPIFFLSKIILIRRFLTGGSNFYTYFKQKFFKRIIKYAIISSVLTVTLFYFLSQFKPMYTGLTPMSHPIFISGLIKGSLLFQIGAIIIVFLSGKRALVLSSIFIYLIYNFIIKKKYKTLIYFFMFFIFLGLTFKITNINLFNISAFQKYEWTINKIHESIEDIDLDNPLIDLISGGRLNEINSVKAEMNPIDYVIGKGIGFTYPLNADYYPYVKNTNNIHFTPLSIISKNGLLFYIVLITFFIVLLTKIKRTDPLSVFFGLYLLGSMTDMLFAYTIFVDPILPISIGYLSSHFNIKKQTKNICVEFSDM